MKMKITVAKILFAIGAILFILSVLSMKVGDFNLVTAGLACVAAGLFFEGWGCGHRTVESLTIPALAPTALFATIPTAPERE